MDQATNRREFLSAGVAGIATAAATKVAWSAGETARPDKLRVALVGCGGRGTHVGDLFQKVPNAELAYVCDVDEARRNSVAQTLNVKSTGIVGDFRRVLDDKSVDIVIVATPDHWHSLAAIMACDAKKNVYVEKPISHNIREGRLLIEAAQRNKVQVQHGTQCRSTSMMIEAVKLLREGIIGDVRVAKCWNIQRRTSIGRGQDVSPPAGFDYDTWIGAATMIPYRTNRVHNRWTMWYHFGVGEIGNDGIHDVDYTRWGLGVEGHPTKIAATGGKLFFDDDSEFPDTQQVNYEYPGVNPSAKPKVLIYEQRLWSTNYPHNCDSGAEFYGDKGQMFLSRRGKIEVLNDKNKLTDLGIKPRAQDAQAHAQNLCDAVRQGTPLTADATTGHLSTSLSHLGNIATRVGRTLTFDPVKEQIVGDDEANKLITREYRDHWAKPKGV